MLGKFSVICYRGGLREGKITGRMEELGKMTRKHKLHILYGQSGLASEYTVYVSNSLVTASKAHIFFCGLWLVRTDFSPGSSNSMQNSVHVS